MGNMLEGEVLISLMSVLLLILLLSLPNPRKEFRRYANDGLPQ